MEKLNKQGSTIFFKIVELINASENKAIKIDNSVGVYMPLSAEFLYFIDFNGIKSEVYSFAHYFEQNGDLVPDPDVTFLFVPNLGIYPMTFQDWRSYHENLFFDDGRWQIIKSKQKDLKNFCNMWLKNIKEQQEI